MSYKDQERKLARAKEYYQENRERILEYRKSRRAEDRENWKRWAEKNPERRLEHLEKYKAKNPEYAKAYAQRNYTRRARRNFDYVCVSCGATEKLHVHHKDRDRANNDITNLEYRCVACHVAIHHPKS